MKTSPEGIALIKSFESLRLEAYQDSADVWTIGWGHTKTAREGQTISEVQAEALFQQDLKEHEAFVDRYVKSAITQSQYDALSSFTFNLGGGALQKSTLLKKVNANPNDPFIATEFQKWIFGGGVSLPGLIRRRKAESDLYYKDLQKKKNIITAQFVKVDPINIIGAILIITIITATIIFIRKI